MFRQLWKNKAYLVINVIGLTVALACAILSVSFLFSQLSFDTFHTRANQIYRLAKKNVSSTTGEYSLNAETSGMMGITLKSDYPEVMEYVRVQPWWDDVLISYKDKNFKASPWVFADNTFFQVFDFDLLRGDPATVLSKPSSIVLTESLSKKLFGAEDPVGQTVVGMNELDFAVTGIVADPPGNSHIRFDALVSWSTTVPGTGPLEYDFMNNWLGQTIYTYLLLEDNADPDKLQSKLEDFMQLHFPERAGNYFLFLQPLKKVYLYSYEFLFSRFPMGSIRLITIFITISIVVLLVACFNYINISTARATRRAAEVGIRKVLGANRRQLIVQFLGESYLLIIISFILSFLLVDIFLPTFNTLTSSSLGTVDLLNPGVVLAMGAILILIGLVSGLYPSFLISGMQPSGMMRPSGNRMTGSKSRQFLTFLQFAVSIALISVSLIIIRQYDFMRNHDVGLEKEKVLVVPTDNAIANSHEAFRNELMSNWEILQVSICQAAIGTGSFGSTVIPRGMDEEMSTQIFRIDKNFLDTYQIQLVDGRWFNSELDTGFSVVINETFVRLAGWKDLDLSEMAINDSDGPPVPVIGIIGDFNYRPLNEVKVDPVLLYIANRNYQNASIRISGENVPETIAHIESTFKKFEKRHPFEYYFVDQWFDQQYKAQDRFMKIIALFTIISIILACLGLYGLTSFTLESKLKEISIRKVLGASISNILITVNRSFFALLFLAIIIGIPVAYYFGNEWLDDFPYRTEISTGIFFTASICAFVISAITVSFQSYKAANTNPTNVLKQE